MRSSRQEKTGHINSGINHDRSWISSEIGHNLRIGYQGISFGQDECIRHCSGYFRRATMNVPNDAGMRQEASHASKQTPTGV